MSEECRVDRSLSHARMCFLGQQIVRAADSCRHDKRIGPSSHPRSNSAARCACYSTCRRSKRVGLVLACVWFSSERGCSENADSSLLESAVLCCIIGFFLRDHPTPFTTTVATGPATAEYQQHRVSTAHVAAAPGE